MTKRVVDLQADGLLWLINRMVFHPLGYALAVDPALPGEYYLLGDGVEPWNFPDGQEQEHLAAVKRLLFDR